MVLILLPAPCFVFPQLSTLSLFYPYLLLNLFSTSFSTFSLLFSTSLGDATPFMDDVSVEGISKILRDLGYQKHGNECMYNGHTGRPFDSLIFLGPTFYQVIQITWFGILL